MSRDDARARWRVERANRRAKRAVKEVRAEAAEERRSERRNAFRIENQLASAPAESSLRQRIKTSRRVSRPPPMNLLFDDWLELITELYRDTVEMPTRRKLPPSEATAIGVSVEIEKLRDRVARKAGRDDEETEGTPAENCRKNVSPKLRFETFKRDGFQCVYCGAKPPDRELRADHVIPVYEGGPTVLENLATSCFECNAGKGKNLLEVAS